MKAEELRERFNSMMFGGDSENLTRDILGMIGDIVIFCEDLEKQKEKTMAPNTAIRAKIKVGNIVEGKNTSRPDSEPVKTNEQITAFGVYSDDPNSENKKWATATPSLSLNMQIDNPGAFGRLEAGREYYLDFVPVESEETKTASA